MAPWGVRFLDLGNFCLYALFCLLLSDQIINSRMRYWIKYSIPFLLYIILFQIREIVQDEVSSSYINGYRDI